MSKNEIMKREFEQKGGFCRYCGQMVMVEAPEDATPEDLRDLASEKCDCNEAQKQRERKRRMKAAGVWAENIFSKNDGQLQTVCCAIKTVFEGAFDSVVIKGGKVRYKINTDKDGMLQVNTTYTDSNTETF